jgi:hypothetical protein
MVKLVSLLEKVQQTPLDVDYLQKRLPKKCKVVDYTALKGHRSDVFRGLEALVVLIPKKGSNLGHFVVLLPREHHIEYFSSLGGTPHSELQALGEPEQRMKEILGKNFIVNTKKLQSGAYNIQDCGVWVLLRCTLRHLKLREFQQLFQSSIHLQTSDQIAACLGAILFLDKPN